MAREPSQDGERHQRGFIRRGGGTGGVKAGTRFRTKMKKRVRVGRTLVELSRPGRKCKLEDNFESRSREKAGTGEQFCSQRLGSLSIRENGHESGTNASFGLVKLRAKATELEMHEGGESNQRNVARLIKGDRRQ